MHTELNGKKFQFITTVKFSHKNRLKCGKLINYWICKCDCGKEIICNIDTLIKGNKHSCGCKRTSHNKKDLSGQRFGMLLVTDEWIRIRPKIIKWKCVCDCGEVRYIQTTNLTQGQISCGCLIHRTGKNNPLYRGYEDISSRYWNKIKFDAETRDIDFLITIKDAWNLFLKQEKKCALTGITLQFNKYSRDITGNASLDRLNSNGPYILKNCQWVDKTLNRIKWNIENNEFIKLCHQVAARNPISS
jgi:hypothetical protein